MNEKIFKLALKAMDFQGAVDIDTELKMSNSELAKFAELIVRECADWIDRQDESRCPYGIDLLEHFGVEE